MKKSLILFLISVMGFMQLQYAQTHRVMSTNENQITFQVQVGDLEVKSLQTEDGNFTRLFLDGAANSVDNIGFPELPVITKMIEIPLCGDVHVTATAGRVRVMTAHEAGIRYDFYPTQPQYHKSYTGDRHFMKDQATYTRDANYSLPLATVGKVGIARDVNMATVSISPVEVNPVTKLVTVYDDITVTVTYDDVDMAATREMKLKYASPEFARPTELINRIDVPEVRDVLTTTPVRYVIIANDMFNGQLDAFADWKRRKGFIVDIAYTGTIGTTTTAITNYISGLFSNATATNPAPTYVLLVGDQAQIPTYSTQVSGMTSHVTDLYYFTAVGSDNVPDCYWGRFSAQNVSQLTAQIDKTLMYEQMTMPDPSYLDNALLVAGEDGGSSGDYGYSMANPAMQYLEDVYSAAYFTSVTSFYNPHASSNAASIRTALSNGMGYANYSAHCASDGWSIPSFSTTNVAQMTNTNKFGLMIGNCCQSNKFEVSECFGEALLRLANKGAVGYIGGTDYTYWYHDYYWAVGAHGNLSTNCTNCNIASYDANHLGAYDCLFHTHNEGYNNWYVTQGSIIYAGNMAVQAAYSATDNYVKYYWEIYELMGDPSVMTWLGQPADMNIRIDNNAPVNNAYEVLDGTTSITVSTGAPYSYIALTHNLNLVTAALSDAQGNATLTFPALAMGETYELAASAQNYKTNFTTITVMAASGARVSITNVAVTNNAQATAGAHLTLDVTIENPYPDAATNTRITATTTSPKITLTDANENIGTVNSGTVRTLNASFALNVSNAITDGEIAPINFTVGYLSNGSAETTTYTFDLELVDALLAYISDSYTITGGNQDNIINPGETVTIHIVDQNIGHATAQNVVSELSTYYNLTPILNGAINIGTLNAQAQCTSSFTVNVANNVPEGTLVPFYHHIYSTTNAALSRIDTIWLVIGSVDAIEDWESNTFTQFDWSNTSTYPWEIVHDANEAFGGEYYAKSGNANRANTQSDLQLTINSTDGEISFYAKVASEPDYDFFKFYIDGNEQLSYSGGVVQTGGSGTYATYSDTCTWQRYAYPITAGTHTIRFSFTKDGYVNGGSDCAKLDNISWPTDEGVIAPEPELLNDISHNIVITSGNGDADINPGENIEITITTENLGPDPLTNVSSVLSTTSPYATISNANETIPYIAPNGTANTTYQISIAPNTPDSTLVTFYHVAASNSDTSPVYMVAINVYEVASPRLFKISDSYVINGGNNDNTIDPGETVVVTIIDENRGRADAPNVLSQLSTYYSPAAVTSGVVNIGTVVAGTQCSSDFTINIGDDVPVGTIIPYVHHIFSTTDPRADRTDTIYLTVGSTEYVEDWETGDMTQFEWTTSNNYPWTIVYDANEAHGGGYYAKSGNYHVASSTSDLELDIATVDGEISFYAKVASQPNADYFRFYIDGNEEFSYSGGVSQTGSGWQVTYTDTCTWQRYSFPITAGNHTIKFSFTKNNRTNAGSDCAKVDDITWPAADGEIAAVPEGIIITSAGLNANSNGYEGENVTFDVELQNNSILDIDDVELTLTAMSNGITLTDATELIPSLLGNQTTSFSNIFAGTISNDIADGSTINCTVTADYLLNGVPSQQSYSFAFVVRAGIVDDVNHQVNITVGNGDNDINPGEEIEITITTENIGVVALNDVSSVLATTSPYATITNATQTISTIVANGSATTTFTVDIAPNTPDNTNISFTHTADAGVHGYDTYTFSINVLVEPFADLEDISENHTVVVGNNDADINPGETVRFSISTRNNGRADAHNAVSELVSDSPYATVNNATQQIGTIPGNATVLSQFDVLIDNDTPDQTVINFTHTMYSDEDTCEMTFSINIVEFMGEVNFVDVSHSISILTGNNDADINPGERIKVTVYSRNDGDMAAYDVTSSLMTPSAAANVVDPDVTFATANPGILLTSQFEVEIDGTLTTSVVVPFTHTITDGESSASLDFTIVVVVPNVGIENHDGEHLIVVYPNPAQDMVTVRCDDDQVQTIAIYDVYGKLVRNIKAEQGETEVNISDIAKGLYFFRLYHANELIGTVKVIKQ